MTRESIAEAFRKLQDHICDRLVNVDGREEFKEDIWKRKAGGGGRTRVFENGAVIEKGGVNFSEVFGEVTEAMKSNTEITAEDFFATGISVVLHPNNPHIPIIHMNVRYFELSDGKYWFGGGIDLTPHYVVKEQAVAFHHELKEVCDKYNTSFYPEFKKWADDYFYLSHRDETRGIGGIFFDHLKEDGNISKEELLDFCLDLGRTFPELYAFQVEKGKGKAFNELDLEWMNIRRSRYVEFNLVHDRGTKFGLVSGGRTESILMSMPPTAIWKYDFHPENNPKASESLNLLVKGIDWIS